MFKCLAAMSTEVTDLVSIQVAYAKAPTTEWKIDSIIAGQVKSGGGLTFVAVEGAGHMVPMDQPKAVSTDGHAIKHSYHYFIVCERV